MMLSRVQVSWIRFSSSRGRGITAARCFSGKKKDFIDTPFAYHETVKVKIRNFNRDGWGVGKVFLPSENSNEQRPQHQQPRWSVMVPNVMVGETVKVRIVRNFSAFSHGELVEVIHRHHRRQKPECQYFGTCGGCQFQHIPIGMQREWKTLFIQRGLFSRGIKSCKVSRTKGSKSHYQYRSKLTPHVGKSKIGFHHQINDELVDIVRCPLATDAVNDKYETVRKENFASKSKEKENTTLLFRQSNDGVVRTSPEESVKTTVNGLEFTYQADDFFQVNESVLNMMVRHVIRAVKDLPYLVDCYSGSGLFALSAAAQSKAVAGIEIKPQAVQAAIQNASKNNITNCRFKTGSAETIFDDMSDFVPSETAVIVCPPRKGCSKEFLDQLLKFAPQSIAYISCDPRTQVRDAKEIVRRYEVQEVQPFDMFPQTRHVECLMVFERKDTKKKKKSQ